MSKQKLLLADDSVTIQKVVNLTFADEGFDVISVGDGNSAMDKIRENMPDIILADVNMPGLNGYEICEKVRQSDGEKRTPVVLLVGSFEPFDENEAKRVGADDFLTKPFQSINQLVNTVSLLLNSNDVVEDETTESELATGAAAGGADQIENGSSRISEFEDAGIDDEMIQTDQVGGMAVGDLTKFEIPAHADSSYETAQQFESSEEIETTSYDSGTDFEIIESNDVGEFGSHEEIESGQQGEGYEIDEEAESSQSYEFVTDEDSESGQEFESTTSDHLEISDSDGEELSLDESNLLELPISEFSEDTPAVEHFYDPQSDTSTGTVETGESTIGSDVEATQEFDEVDSSQHYGTEDQPGPTPETDFVTIDEGEFTANTQSEGDESDKAQQETDYLQPQFGTIGAGTSPDYEKDHKESEALPAAQAIDSLSPELIEEIAAKVEAKLEAKAPEERSAADLVTPELIDEISRRVIENLSGNAIKEIAWEIVPQQSERIIREIANEKMNE